MTRQAKKKPTTKATREARVQRPAIGKDGKCGAQVKGDRRRKCGKVAGWGTNHVGYGPCKLHGGSMRNVVKRAQTDMAADAVENYGLPVETNPQQALMDELNRTAGHVAWLGQVVANLEEDDTVGPVGEEGVDDKTGLTHYPRAEPSVWLRLYQAERKHLTDVAATCLKVGIEERRVRVAEAQAQMFATALNGILSDLGVKITKEVAEVIRRNLMTIEATEARELVVA